MSVEHVTGDLFTHPGLDALGHGVNCQGAMGKGIALGFRRLDEQMYLAYRDLCTRRGLDLGDLFPWKLADGRWVYNMASQFRTGRDARLSAIRASLGKALEHAVEHEVRTVGIPHIGCDIGGLSFTDVSRVIDEVAGGHQVHVVVVKYAPC